MPAPEPITLTFSDGTTTTFASLSQACKATGKPYKLIHKRLKYFGWTPEEAFGITPKEERPKTVMVTLRDGSVRTYKSIRSAAKAFGIGYLVAFKRLKRGWTPEQTFKISPPPKRMSAMAREVVVENQGEIFRWPSLSQAAIANGQTLSAVRSRLKSGETMAEALGINDSSRRPHKAELSVLIGGSPRTFESVSAAARHFNLSVELVYQRIKKLGWSNEEALELTPRTGYDRSCYGYIYVVTHLQTGRQYVGQTKAARVEDRWKLHVQEVNKKSRKKMRPLIRAIKEYGESAFKCTAVDKARSQGELNKKERQWIQTLNTLLPNGFNATRGGQGSESGKSVIVRGVRFRTMSEASRKFGVPLSTVSRWLQKGTPEQAFGLAAKPRLRNSRGQVVEFEWAGTKYRYDSIRAAANAHGVPEKNVQRRLKTGWTTPQALGLDRRPSAEQKKAVCLTVNGQTLSYESRSLAAKAHGIPVQTVTDRLRRGWDIREALFIPPGNQGKRKGRKR